MASTQVDAVLTLLNNQSVNLDGIQYHTTARHPALKPQHYRVFLLVPPSSQLPVTVAPHYLAIGPHLVPGLTPAELKHIHQEVTTYHLANSHAQAAQHMRQLLKANSVHITKSSNDISH